MTDNACNRFMKTSHLMHRARMMRILAKRSLLSSVGLTCAIALSLLFLVGYYSFTSYASENELSFERITSAEGLSHDTVYSITQDQLGFMWFATEDGLNRYDGYQLELYEGKDKDNQFGNANYALAYVDRAGLMWVASWGGGMKVLNHSNGTVTNYLNDPTRPGSISDNSIQNIFQDSEGIIWIGTYTGGLNKFDKKTNSFKSYQHDESNNASISDNRVWWISEDVDGNLLIATNVGLDKFNPTTEKFTHYSQIKNRVRTMHWDRSKTLWLGTQMGLCKFDTKTGTPVYYMQNTDDPLAEVITSIYEDSYNNFWVGTSSGINLFDKKGGVFKRFVNDAAENDSLSNNDIRVIFEDTSANLWIGTRGGGINKLDIKPHKFTFYDSTQNSEITLNNINVMSIFQSSDGVIWVGTNNGGLNRFDLKTHTQKYLMTDITKDENRDINAICEDETFLWIGSLGGLNRLNKQTGKIETFKNNSDVEGTLTNNTVLSLLQDRSGSLWVGTLGGLNKYDPASNHFTGFFHDSELKGSISADTINCLYEDTKDNFWIGTQNGLNLMDRKSGTFTSYLYDKSKPKGLSDNIIHCIFEDSSNNLWIGTQNGLNLFDPQTGNSTIYTVEEGLPNNCIHGILEDTKGQLWISTNKGLSCFDVKEQTFINYDAFDGLQGNGYNNNACETLADGRLLFGGTRGLDLFQPTDISKSSFMPPLVITEFKVMDKEYDFRTAINENGRIELGYNENNIWAEFASLDYTMSSRNQYAYMLEGFDEDWNTSGSNNILNYTNIPSGDYVLKVRGTNSDGIWNEESLSIKISVGTPWWLSGIAYAVYFIMALILGYILVLYITRKQIRKNRKLAKMLQHAVNVMSRIGEMRDLYTAGHQQRVQQLSCAIAKEMGLPKEVIENIHVGALIHDIGKINISPDFLNKPGNLTDIEYQILQTHVTSGYDIIKEIEFPTQVMSIVCQHHERLDGSGYPNNLSGEDISIESRIVGVADVVEAMSTDRPYRAALGIEVALEEINKFRDIKYDSSVVDTCNKLFKEKGFEFQ